MIWCRVLALLTVITFVFANQSFDTKNGALDSSLDNLLNLNPNHIITKRDVKDPEKKRTKQRLRKRRKNTKPNSKKKTSKNKQGIKKKNASKPAKKGKKKPTEKRSKDKKKR